VRSVGVSADHVRSFDWSPGRGEYLRVTHRGARRPVLGGLRGGKATLGIVAAVEIDLLPIAEFYGGALYFDGGRCRRGAADLAAVVRRACRRT
jgi:FAD/FMN-containing dehydrogenase